MIVTVYSKPGCVQCDYTVKNLVKLDIDHHVIDVLQDKEAYEKVAATGNLQMPMVVADEQIWHGFNIDRIKALAQS